MIKWGDYLISAVRFEEKDTVKYISHVKANIFDHGKPQHELTPTREQLIRAMDDGITFGSIFWNDVTKKWEYGEKVFKALINNVYYLKTRSDNSAKDNLENLPTF